LANLAISQAPLSLN